MLAQVVQGGGVCPIPGNIRGQVGQGSEQPDVAQDTPAYRGRFGLNDLKCVFQPTPLHEDLMTMIRRGGAASGGCSCQCSKGHHPKISHLPCGGSPWPCVGVPQLDCWNNFYGALSKIGIDVRALIFTLLLFRILIKYQFTWLLLHCFTPLVISSI